MQKVKAACLQMRSGVSVLPNIEIASAQIREAASKGAQLVATPEMTNLLDIRRGVEKERPVVEVEDPSLAAFRSLAGELGIWLLIGSLAIALEDERRKANRSFLIAPSGDIAARYDKINMFDVMLGDSQTYRESDAYRPGQEAVLARTAIGAIGLTICYDLRFPQLYRTLAQSGAEILACPAAFTRVTGEAHWHALLRARAVETGAYILAPAQGGKHQDGRETYGHALIVSPWGEILAEADHADPCVIYADLDLGEVVKARQRIPSLASDRPFVIKVSEF